ncbi:substrate-binding domain-containing protein [Rhizobacter sp. SG703]|uniref:substrate-binding domain-containing protein n=1 Tax=Rhizobacter sp. SG703 TaxID=2587140 RepID=UPI0018088C7B|nr:substrate-binding domain-containing protein [Rhizobacter sp. SG703]NKI93308.1 ribose transport system substrate-binding protein [Rhizobacter sp. SG703]
MRIRTLVEIRACVRALMPVMVAAAALAAPPSAGPARAADGRPAAPLAEAQQVVASAVRCGDEPRVDTGPPAQPGKSIAMVIEDLRNGGVLAASLGLREAAAAIGWNVKVFDLGGIVANRDKVMQEVMAFRPDGIALMGGLTLEGSSTKGYGPYDLTPFERRGIVLVSWHANPWPGPIAGTPVRTNVTSDPLLVARMAASKAIIDAGGRAGVVIFTDSKLGMAMTKAHAMAEVVRACKECQVLEMLDVGMEETGSRMAAVTAQLLQRYGKRLTHALAVNDIYFDYMVPALITAQQPGAGVRLISGGDGSSSAFLRIAAKSFQTATAADPLNQQGWQTVDELNRLFAHQPTSGFVAPPRLVTSENIACEGGSRMLYDPDNGYRDAYKRIWKR